MKRYTWFSDGMQEDGEGPWTGADKAETLLRRAVEAIENLVDLDRMPLTDSERDWTISQCEGVVADIRNALGGQDD